LLPAQPTTISDEQSANVTRPGSHSRSLILIASS
jgi:hypothetical protein